MSTFEFVSVLLSIVLSLAVTHLLTGVANAIRARPLKFALSLAGWWLFVLLLCVDQWFSLWALRDQKIWSFGFVLFQMLGVAVLYVAARLVVPERAEDGSMDMVAYNAANRRSYIAAIAAWVVYGVITNGVTPSLELANLLAPATLILLGTAWVWGDRRVQYGCLVLIFVLFTYYAFTFVPAL